MRLRRAVLALPAALVLADLLAQQDTESSALEEIVVTARKIAEPLQDAPAAISAFTGDALTLRGAVRLDDVSRHVPNMALYANGISGNNSGQAYIRGVGQADYLLTTDPGVGIYVDGVYLARTLGSLIDLLDIERVEVLRGPQGTLYGKNAVGGAVNVITRKPTEARDASVDVAMGSYDRLDAGAHLGGRLGDGALTGRLAFGSRNADGFGRRPLAGDRSGDERSHGVRGQLRWAPDDDLEALFTADYTLADTRFAHHRTEEINGAAPLVALHNALAGPLAPLHGVSMVPYDERWLSDSTLVDFGTGVSFDEQENRGLSSTIDWAVGPGTLRSITAFRHMDLVFGTDPDGSPAVIVDEVDDIGQRQATQELQYSGQSGKGRQQWIAGLYYLSERSHAAMNVRLHEAIYPALEQLPAPLVPLGNDACPAPLPALCAGGAGNPLNTLFDIGRQSSLRQRTASTAVYGHVNIELAERWRATYGVRYTAERKRFGYELRALQTGSTVVAPSVVADRWTDVSHRAGLEYRFTDDAMLYAAAAEGFKSGGFNGRGRSANEIQAYAPENVRSYELGFKSEWAERRVRLNAAAFRYDYTDMQFTLSTADAGGLQLVVVDNVAAAKIEGVEIEAVAAVTERLRIDVALGRLDARYTRVDPGAEITLGHELAGAPRRTSSIGGEYTLPLAGARTLSVHAGYSYRSKTYFDAINTESVAQPGHALVTVRVALAAADGRRSLALGVRNATDEIYRAMGVGVLDSLGFASAVYARPREWYLHGRYRF